MIFRLLRQPCRIIRGNALNAETKVRRTGLNIFISHNSKDKPQVEHFASALSKVYGRDSVFYDSWSIQPGDGIIDKMNSGLSTCDFFVFFLSKNSLTSQMVKLEWQNALMASAQGEMRFIPVKLDDCDVPPLLRQKLYINLARDGEEMAIRQLFDVIQGDSTYREPADDKFFNLKAYARTAQEGFRIDLEIRATAYTEPISRYCVILKNKDANVWCTSDSLHESGRGTIDSQDGSQLNAYLISVGRATTTGFPMRIAITNNETIGIEGVFHAVGENQYEKVPIVVVLPKEMFGFASDIEVPIDDVVGSDKTQKELYNYMANKMTEALVGSNVPKV